MRDLAKNNDGSGANVANGNGTTGDNVGATGKIDTTELSASELYRLGRGLCVGVYGIKIDKRRGVALPEAAVEAGKAADASDETKSAALDAQAELAERTSDGLEDAPPDWERAVELAAKPAEAGNPFALFTLGNAASEGVGGFAQSAASTFERRAVDAFLKRAKDGCVVGDDPRAMCFAAYYLNAGRCVKRDFAEAIRLKRRAVEIGCAEAALNLAVAYLNGDGVAFDSREAARWTRVSAELGDARAARDLGEYYCDGFGVEKDETKAVR
ncbi:MAG: sel1 repeat family protein [Thermoguttaceae bacterium]|nr:sel1 repeat family protein [Thermoguttaceae bacterium]